MLRRHALAALLALSACRRSTPSAPTSAPTPSPRAPAPTPTPAPTPPADVQPAQPDDAGLPPPDATPSARNPPRIVDRPRGAAPVVAGGMRATLWAEGFRDGRVMAQAPSGEVFVTEAGRDRVVVLRDADGDGRADAQRDVWADRLQLPFGIAFHPDGWLYVACTDAVVRWRYRPGQTRAEGQPEVIVQLPGRGYNQHWTRNIAFSADHQRVFFTVGSETNNDVERDPRRATVGVADINGRNGRVFASGIRNPVGIALHPDTNDLYVVVNERDHLGDGLVPDYLTRVQDGQFYGWPYAYWGRNVDPAHRGERPDLVARSVTPDLALGAHVAAVALLFPTRDAVGVPRGDALVSEHGSWNHSEHVGYKVVRVRFRDGRPTGEIEDFITGFGLPDDAFWGRPAGLAELSDGSLLLAEDAGGTIWRISNPRLPTRPQVNQGVDAPAQQHADGGARQVPAQVAP